MVTTWDAEVRGLVGVQSYLLLPTELKASLGNVARHYKIASDCNRLDRLDSWLLSLSQWL